MNRIKWVALASMCILTCIPLSRQTGCGVRIPYDEGAGESTRSKKQSRIIGGRDALPGEWPWTVSVQSYFRHFCTGSILSPYWVLSAAHCFNNTQIKYLAVQVGANVLEDQDEILHIIEKVFIHENFNNKTVDNDVALLKLKLPIEINKLTTPICLPPPETFNADDWRSCHVAGWGVLSEGSKNNSKILQNVEMKLIDMKRCRHLMFGISKNMFCAGYEEGGRDACQGDSGGPLMCQKLQGKTWYQVGIVSWGSGCGRKNTPGMYSILSNYLTWIQKVTREAGHPIEQGSQHMPSNMNEQAKKDKDDTENPDLTTKSCATRLMHAILVGQYLWVSVAVLQESSRFIQ